MGPTILFTQLKIILLQCFQFSVFSFQFSATISSIQTDPKATRIAISVLGFHFSFLLSHLFPVAYVFTSQTPNPKDHPSINSSIRPPPPCATAMSPYHGIILLPYPWTQAATPPSSSVDPDSEPINRERELVLCSVIVPHPDQWSLDLPNELRWLPQALQVNSVWIPPSFFLKF